jgi:hypothetical protein
MTRFLPVTVVCCALLAPPAPAQPPKDDPALPPAPGQPPAKEEPTLPPALAAKPGEDPVRALRIERHNALREWLVMTDEMFRLRGPTAEESRQYAQVLARFFDARLELESDQAERVRTLGSMVAAAGRRERQVEQRVKNGVEPPQNLSLARADRLGAEIRLAEEKARAKPATPAAAAPPLVWVPCPCPPPAPRTIYLFPRR